MKVSYKMTLSYHIPSIIYLNTKSYRNGCPLDSWVHFSPLRILWRSISPMKLDTKPNGICRRISYNKYFIDGSTYVGNLIDMPDHGALSIYGLNLDGGIGVCHKWTEDTYPGALYDSFYGYVGANYSIHIEYCIWACGFECICRGVYYFATWRSWTTFDIQHKWRCRYQI